MANSYLCSFNELFHLNNENDEIEIKQDSHASSLMKSILLDLRVKPLRLSKYCVGTVLTNAEVKNSRFKEKLRAVGKMTGKRYL